VNRTFIDVVYSMGEAVARRQLGAAAAPAGEGGKKWIAPLQRRIDSRWGVKTG